MAQIVEIEPGDILVVGSMGGFDPERVRPLAEQLKEILGIPLVVFLDGPVDLGVVRKHIAESGTGAVAGA